MKLYFGSAVTAATTHTMDGAHAGRFLELLQKAIYDF